MKARRELVEMGTDFEERIVDGNEEWQDEAMAISKQVTVPVLVWPDGRVEVGWKGERG